MHKIGIRIAAAGSVRHFRATATMTSSISPPFRHSPLSERYNTRNGRFSFPTKTLSVAALTAAGSVYAHSDTNDEDSTASEHQRAVEEDDSGVDATIEVRSDSRKPLQVLKSIVSKMMDSENRVLMYGLMGANAAVYAAFLLADYLYKLPTRRAALLRFLSRNFILSAGWLSRGRWHVVLTSTFTHLSAPHLIRSMWGIFTGVWLCSEHLEAWQIAGLYLGGGTAGGIVSGALTRYLRNSKYMVISTGASGAIYALWFYYGGAQDLELSGLSSVPFAVLVKALFLYIFVRDGVGLRKFLRYGYRGKGSNSVRYDHAAHLGGAMTGVLAYAVPRALQCRWGEVTISYTERMKEEEGTGRVLK